MVSVKDKGIVIYIIEHCKRIEEKISGITKEMFDLDKDIQEIVCFNILQIGELAKKLNKEFTKDYSLVPWNEIKGMRDMVAHGYETLDLERVYQTATEDIRPLREYCELILSDSKDL